MPKILIIDDEPFIVNFLERLARSLGYEVVTALNGRSACDLAADPSIKLILSDLHMPGTPSRIQLIRQLRALRPECPIVVITGYPSETSIKECQQLGVHDFLTKPFEMPFISSILNRLAPIPDKSRPKVTS